jgi:hypothetical protein
VTFKQWLARRRTWTGAVGEVVAYTEADPHRVLWTTPSELRGRLLRLQPGSPWFDRAPSLVAALDEVERAWKRSRDVAAKAAAKTGKARPG